MSSQSNPHFQKAPSALGENTQKSSLTFAGTIRSIIGLQVAVTSVPIKSQPKIDIQNCLDQTLSFDSVLFTKTHEKVGKIQDIIGNVNSPIYIIDIDPDFDIEAIHVGDHVFSTPTNSSKLGDTRNSSQVLKKHYSDEDVIVGGEDLDDENDLDAPTVNLFPSQLPGAPPVLQNRSKYPQNAPNNAGLISTNNAGLISTNNTGLLPNPQYQWQPQYPTHSPYPPYPQFLHVHPHQGYPVFYGHSQNMVPPRPIGPPIFEYPMHPVYHHPPQVPQFPQPQGPQGPQIPQLSTIPPQFRQN